MRTSSGESASWRARTAVRHIRRYAKVDPDIAYKKLRSLVAGAKNRHPPPLAVIRSCDTAAPRRSVRIEEQLGSKAPEMLVLYNAPHPTCSQKVRLCLAEKKLPFKEIKLHPGPAKIT